MGFFLSFCFNLKRTYFTNLIQNCVKYFLDENKLSRITGSDWRKCDIIAVTYPL